MIKHKRTKRESLEPDHAMRAINRKTETKGTPVTQGDPTAWLRQRLRWTTRGVPSQRAAEPPGRDYNVPGLPSRVGRDELQMGRRQRPEHVATRGPSGRHVGLDQTRLSQQPPGASLPPTPVIGLRGPRYGPRNLKGAERPRTTQVQRQLDPRTGRPSVQQDPMARPGTGRARYHSRTRLFPKRGPLRRCLKNARSPEL